MNKNNFKTFVLLAALGGALVLAGSAFGRGGAFIGLGIGLLFVGGSYWFSDKIAIAAARAKPVSESEAPGLYRMVREIVSAANMPMPRLYMTPDMQPNAFATGRSPSRAAVAVTKGITEMLSEDELKGVIAHEIAHVRNRDILIGSVAAAVAMGITFIARMAMWGTMFAGGDEDGPNPLALLAMAILAPVAAILIQMAISRSREFEADHDGAELIGNPESLARALEKMELAAKKVPMNVNPAQASMYIVNPLSGRRVNFARMFMTHPPTEERIERLRSMAYGRIA